jgi:ABC-2 type transport system ATP-binding protein
MNLALTIDSVVKRFDAHVAVDDLSVAIPRGVIYGILGPNGAGKTTTIRMVMNIIARDAGSISVLGKDPASNTEVLRSIGYLPEERGLYKKMQVLDVIIFFGQLKGMKESTARKTALDWLSKMGLSEWAAARVETLSKGMQQKVQFIATVLHEPELLILDEPTSGLDPVNQEVLRETILNAKQQGRSVILSTHNMEQAEQMCDSVCIIAGGKKVLDGELKELRRMHSGRRYGIELESSSDANAIVAKLQQTPGLAAGLQQDQGRIEFDLSANASTRDALRILADADVQIASFAHVQPSLRDIFVRYANAASVADRRSQSQSQSQSQEHRI